MEDETLDPGISALRALCKKHGGHAAVAKAIDANPQTIHQIISGVKLPSGRPRGVGRSLREKLTATFPGWLNSDAIHTQLGQPAVTGLIRNVEPGPEIRGWVPLISWVQAGYGVSAVDNLHPGEGEKIETTYKARRHTYALRVKGDSMEPKFPQGCLVIVEPEEDPVHGKFVIVRRNGDEPTLKQYIEEGGSKFLKPINTRYPIELMQADDAFCGVVKRMEQDV